MNDSLHNENRAALAGLASTITFPYLWFSLFVFLGALYNVGFFGRDIGGIIVMALVGLLCVIPAVPLALTRFVVRPLFNNLLGRELISHTGCITGLISIVLAGFVTVYVLSRGGFTTAALLLLAAPVVGALLAAGVSLLTRGGVRLPSRGRAAPAISVSKPSTRALPGARKPEMLSSPERPALPTSQTRPSRLPTTRRSGSHSTPARPSHRSQPPVRRQPPRRNS